MPDEAVDLSFFHWTELGVDDPPGAVDDDGKRKRSDSVSERPGKLDRAVSSKERRVVEPDLVCELTDFVAFIGGDSDKLQASGAEFSLGLYEFGHLLPARRTPRRPEVDDKDLPLPLLQGLVRTPQIR